MPFFSNSSNDMPKLCARLEKCLHAAVPEVHLNPGANDAQIIQAQDALGVTLPTNLIDFYRVFNGQDKGTGGIIFTCSLLSLEEMVTQWKIWEGVAKDFADDNEDADTYGSLPPEYVKSMYINPKWIPFTHDWGGNHIGVDLDPGPRGTSGQVICFGRDEDHKHVLGKSFKLFVEGLVEAFERGQFVVTEGRDLDMDAYYHQLLDRAAKLK